MITIYDDLANEYREFHPIQDGMVTMYVCGITAYDSPHIGHARSAVAFDVIRRYLEFHGYNVKYVMNYTDVDDKMINRANDQGTTIYKIAEKYINEYEFMQKALLIKPPTVRPRATQEIPEMVEMIRNLERKGFTYQSGGSVYFDTSKMEGYKSLFRKKETISEDDEFTQSDFAEEKKNLEDFVLWKKEKPGEPSWDSPWGKGRPGWHIECSVMAQKYLGPTIDIHGGGKDLKQPHHQNEIAQSECANEQTFVNYWMHNGFLNIDNQKMSKSLGNFIPLMEMLEKFTGTLIRYYFATSYYKRPMDFSMPKLEEASKNLDKIQGFYTQLASYKSITASDLDSNDLKEQETEVDQFQNQFLEAMDYDFNSAKAMGYFFAMMNYFQKKVLNVEGKLADKVKVRLLNFLDDLDEVFQFIIPKQEDQVEDSQIRKQLTSIVESILTLRKKMKAEKNYPIADQLRDILISNGIIVNDKGNESTWEFEK